MDLGEEKKSVIDIPEKESAQLTFEGGRGLFDYMASLHFRESDLRGKKILDIGSDRVGSNTFARDIEEKLPDAKVVTFGFNADRTGTNELQQKGPANSVKGLFTKLPFQDSSFDIVVSSAAMPLYLHGERQIRDGFSEVIRVLKSGGKAYIGPVSYTDVIGNDPNGAPWDNFRTHSYEDSKRLFSRILEHLGSPNMRVGFEFVTSNIENGIKFLDPSLVITKK